ncbi:MAG: hypothetical protein AB7G48_08100 [Nitrospiraceae bacterium]
MSVSPEEFFMYLTIGLIVVIPVSVRIYRRLTMNRTAQMLKEEFGVDPDSPASDTSTDSKRS